MNAQREYNIDFENGRETGQDEARDQVVYYLAYRRNYLIKQFGIRNEEAAVWLYDSLIRAITDDQHWTVGRDDADRLLS